MVKNPKRTRWGVAAPALFFAAHFLYVWLRIDPRLLYEGGMLFPPFRTGTAFAVETLARPGGLAEYLGAAGAQTYYRGWAGALCITTVSALLYLLTCAWMRALEARRAAWAAYVPPLLVIATYGAYGQPLAMLCSLALALALALLYVRLTRNPQSAIRDLLLFLLLGVAAYAAAGGAMILYAVPGGLVAAKASGHRLRGLLYFVAAEAIPCILGVLWLDLPFEQAYWRVSALDLFLDGRGRVALVALTLYYPALVAFLIARQDGTVAAPPAVEIGRTGQTAHSRPVRPALRWVLAAVAVAALCHFTLDMPARQTRQVHYFTAQHQWERALDVARGIPARGYSFDLAHNIYRALYHSGRLLSDLFAYPQQSGAMLICMPENTGIPESISRLREARYLDLGEQALEFGLANSAVEEGHEALAVWGDHATTLRRLASAYIAKGQPEAARVFLNVLRRDLVQGRWAAETLARMEHDPLLEGDPWIREARSLMFQRDPEFFFSTTDAMCSLLRQQNPMNRMAYEYLIAYYLTERNAKAVVRALDDLDDFGYSEMPRLCQEAVVLLEVSGGKREYTGSYPISPEAFQRFTDFSNRVRPLQEAGRIDEARRAAEADFGDTFYFYYVFGESGGMRP